MKLQTIIFSIIIIITLWVGTWSKALSTSKEILPTINQTQVLFEGETPSWGADALAIMAQLEQWRGLAFIKDVPVSFQEHQQGKPLGWYDPENQELVVTTGNSERLSKGVMLHELYHALQDQHFGITKLQQLADTQDAQRAVQAVIEGEAMLAVSELMDYDFTAHAQLPMEGEVNEALFEKLFVYGDGMNLIRQIRAIDNWQGIERLWQQPPLATKLVYHPQLYISGKSQEMLPIKMTEGEALVESQLLGEYYFRLWLARSPETRLLLPTMADAYESDIWVKIKTMQGQERERWTLRLTKPEFALKIAEVAPQAMQAQGKMLAQIQVSGNEVELEW